MPRNTSTAATVPAVDPDVVPPTPSEALDVAVLALVEAAEAYAAADGTTTHSYVSGDYLVRFQGEQLLSLTRR